MELVNTKGDTGKGNRPKELFFMYPIRHRYAFGILSTHDLTGNGGHHVHPPQLTSKEVIG
jgi:hypothetical protein